MIAKTWKDWNAHQQKKTMVHLFHGLLSYFKKEKFISLWPEPAGHEVRASPQPVSGSTAFSSVHKMVINVTLVEDMSHEIHTVPAPACLGVCHSASAHSWIKQISRMSSSIPAFTSWVSSELLCPPASTGSPNTVRISGHWQTTPLSLLLSLIHRFPGYPLPWTCPVLFLMMETFVLHSG